LKQAKRSESNIDFSNCNITKNGTIENRIFGVDGKKYSTNNIKECKLNLFLNLAVLNDLNLSNQGEKAKAVEKIKMLFNDEV
jgi:hypothetical protein